MSEGRSESANEAGEALVRACSDVPGTRRRVSMQLEWRLIRAALSQGYLTMSPLLRSLHPSRTARLQPRGAGRAA